MGLLSPSGLETAGVCQGGASQWKVGVQVWWGRLGLEEPDGELGVPVEPGAQSNPALSL